MINHHRTPPSAIIAACFFVVFLMAQLMIPVAQLAFSPRPARFGWQMYSVISVAPSFTLIMRDGATRPLDIRPYVTSLRGDVPLARFLPPHLCRIFPDAAAVHIQMDDGLHVETYSCDQ